MNGSSSGINKSPQPETQATFEISEDGFQKYEALMLKKQNVKKGVLGGIAAAVLILAVWTVLMLLLSVKLSWMILAAGAGIGFCTRYLGKGVTKKFGIAVGVITLPATLIGMLMTACIVFAKGKHLPLLSVVADLSPKTIFFFLKAIIGPLDFLLIMGAIGLAYYLAFKPVQQNE
jgi:hypothetical protein